MTIEAAYHEAGHAVTAHLSPFHGIAHPPLSVGSAGSGAAHIRLSKNKLSTAGKQVQPVNEADPDVAESIAVVLAAGLVSEQLAAKQNSQISPNPALSIPDHQELRKHTEAAGINSDVTFYEEKAATILSENWAHVERLAQLLMKYGCIEGVDAEMLLNNWQKKSSA